MSVHSNMTRMTGVTAITKANKVGVYPSIVKKVEMRSKSNNLSNTMASDYFTKRDPKRR